MQIQLIEGPFDGTLYNFYTKVCGLCKTMCTCHPSGIWFDGCVDLTMVRHEYSYGGLVSSHGETIMTYRHVASVTYEPRPPAPAPTTSTTSVEALAAHLKANHAGQFKGIEA